MQLGMTMIWLTLTLQLIVQEELWFPLHDVDLPLWVEVQLLIFDGGYAFVVAV